MRRLGGLLLIIRAFAPVLALLTLYWGYTRVVGDFQAALAPVQQIESEISALGETIDSARGQFDIVKSDVEAAIVQLQTFRVPDLLPDLSLNLTIPDINIPDLAVPIVPTVSVDFTNATGSISRTIDGVCRTVLDFLGIGNLICDPVKTVTESLNFSYPSGIRFGTTRFTLDFPSIPSFNIAVPPFFNTVADQIEGLFSGFKAIFNLFDSTFAAINSLGLKVRDLPDSFNSITAAAQALGDHLTLIVQERTGLITLVMMVSLALAVIYFATSFVKDFAQGWRILFGQPRADRE